MAEAHLEPKRLGDGLNIVIDNEFKRLIPPLQADEYSQLEQSILDEGCRDALVVWPLPEYDCEGDILHWDDYTELTWLEDLDGGESEKRSWDFPDGTTLLECDWPMVLVDGHNRYKICTERNIPFEVVTLYFESRQDAIVWIISNQIGRRNLHPLDKVPLLERKREILEAQAKQSKVSQLKQNSPVVKNFSPRDEGDREERKVRTQLAKEAGVSHPTYEALRDVNETGTEPLKQAVRDKRIGASTAAQVASLEPEIQDTIVSLPSRREIGEAVKQHVHVGQNSGDNEWYTPLEYIVAARAVMGDIDLDPASSEIANKTVQAVRYYTAEDDGLKQPWDAKRIWLNPPYAQPLCTQFCERLVEAVEAGSEAVLLVNNATETRWFQNTAKHASAVCFPLGRVKFEKPDGPMGAPLQGQAFLYFGENAALFRDVFADKGLVF